MRTLSIMAAVAMTLLYLANVSAQGDKDLGLSRDYDVCMDKSGGVTANMLNCIAAETKRQDARLNKIYKEVMAAQMDDAGKKRLLEAQRAWIKFRDTDVAFYSDPNGGTAATLAGDDRYLMMTARRAAELDRFKQQ